MLNKRTFEGSLLALMGSIRKNFNVPYYVSHPEIDSLLRQWFDHVVLLVIDGCGEHILKKFPQSTLAQHKVGTLNSLFPSSTGVCITTFLTGLSPAQHGIYGWVNKSNERNELVYTFLSRPVLKKAHILTQKNIAKEMLPKTTLSREIHEMNILTSKTIGKTQYNKIMSKGARLHTHKDKDISDFAKQLQKILHGRSGYTYAYWSQLDSLSHIHGPHSPVTYDHFRAIDNALTPILKQLPPRSCVLVTADHGQVETLPEHHISLSSYPEIQACLQHPLGAEPRTPFFYVQKGKERKFESLFAKHLEPYGTLFTKDQIVKAEMFGPEPLSKKNYKRVGDYIMLMKSPYMLFDTEKHPWYKGSHGGLHQDECLVPLCFFSN